MKMIRSKQKMTTLIGLLAIVLGFVFLTPKTVQADDDNTLAANAPWGLNDGINQLFDTWQGSKQGYGWSAGNHGGTNAYVYQSGNSSSPAYLWSKTASFDLMKKHVLSYWILLGTGDNNSTDNVNDGMAFVLNGSSTTDPAKLRNGSTYGDAIGGTSIGVWGKSTDNDPWSTGMKKSLAVEFDPYQNWDNYDSNTKDTQKKYDIGAGYPGESYSYPTSGSKYTKKNLNLVGEVEAQTGDYKISGRWMHVTFTYTPPSTTSGTGNLAYTVDDINPTTGKDQLTAANSRNTYVDLTKLLADPTKSTMAYLGWVSSDKSNDQNMVVMDTNSDWLNATATSQVTDKKPADGSGAKTVSNGSVVYGGDPLEYTYTITNVKSNQTPNGAQAVYLRTKLPAGFDLGSSNVIGKVTYSNGADSEDITKSEVAADGTLTHKLKAVLASDTSAKLTISGNAAIVSTDTPVTGSDWRAYNGGVDQAGTNPSYTIKPGIITSVTANAKNLSDYGSTALASAKTIVGDKIQYTFVLTYRHNSVLDWNDSIAANFDLPTQFKPSSLTVDYGGAATQKASTYTGADVKSGITLPAGFAVNTADQTVTLTLDGTVDGSGAAGSATANFSSPKHSDSGTTPGFTINPIPDTGNLYLGLTGSQGPTTTIKQTATSQTPGKHINVPGIVAEGEGTTKNSDITMVIKVTRPDGTTADRHVQLTDSGIDPGQFNMMFVNPINQVDDDPMKIQSVDTETSPLLQKGINTVTLQAYDLGAKRASNPVTATIDVGGELKFDSGNSATMDFKDTTLTGKTQYVGLADPAVMKVINTKETTWQVYASMGAGGFQSNGKALSPQLYYYDGTPGGWWTMNRTAPAIVGSGTSDQAKSGKTEVDIASGWKSTGVTEATQADVEKNAGPGLYMEIKPESVADITGTTYSGSIDWDLIDSVQ